jgi:predicted cobalt transporter CbtA
MRAYMARGLFVGLLAGIAAFAFAQLVGEPEIDAAIAVEEAAIARSGEAAEDPLVTRSVQKTIGLGTGAVVAGVALGGLFALAFGVARYRVTHARARTAAMLVALAAFVTIDLVPFLKYPANPPAVGDPDTIGRRTALYMLLIVFAVLSAILAAVVHRRAVTRVSKWDANLIAVATFTALIAAGYVLMPGVDEVVPGFPASLLWRFRVASLGMNAVLWATIGLAFGALTERAESRVYAGGANAVSGTLSSRETTS